VRELCDQGERADENLEKERDPTLLLYQYCTTYVLYIGDWE
jgi:hypothetical protein